MDLQDLVGANQSIKIVPSIEDTLRSSGLDVDLDDAAQTWFNQLKITWRTWKKSQTIEEHLQSFFHSRPDPYRCALAMVIKCEEFKDSKPKTLPYCIIDTLVKWSQTNSVLPDDSLKLPAFSIATYQRNQHFFSLVVKAYHLSTIKESILPIVKGILEEGNYKLATQMVVAMEISSDIPVEDLLFPLVLQDKANMIDEYLTECPSQIKPFLLFVDKLLDKTFSVRDYVQNYIETHKVVEVRYDKVHHKPLGKLLGRLCNKFKIPIESCKNLSRNRTTGGLRYLVHQKYLEKNVSSTVWDDLVKDSLKQNVDSAFEFIDLLCEYDMKEARKWAEYLSLPISKYPPGLADSASVNDTGCNEETEVWDDEPIDSQAYYQLKVPLEQIILVDTGEKFYDMMNSDLKHCKLVSMDCEWKPSFGATQSQVALIQVATYDKVFLIDCTVLNRKEFNSFWYTFHKSLLDNAEIIKLGFGLEQDLKEVKASIIGLSHIKVKGEGLLDMSLLWKSLLDSGLVLPSNSDSMGNGLSFLVQSCFSLPLAKSEQCSNWELRPLRTTQIQYAALDAHVLIDIYYYLHKLCYDQGVNFDDICNDIMLEGKQKNSKKSKVAERIQASISLPKCVNEVKFLVDPALSNLMCYFRYCGIDTTVMPLTMQWHDCINLAISEDRSILLPKTKYTPTVKYDQKSILDVGLGGVKEQLMKTFTYFNIGIQVTNLLSRCIYCNEKKLTKLSSSEIGLLKCENKGLNNYPTNHFDHGNEVEYDKFLSDSDDDHDLYQPIDAYVKATYKTNNGVPVQIDDIDKLLALNKSALLCEPCGRLLWDDEELLKPVSDLVQSLTKLTFLPL